MVKAIQNKYLRQILSLIFLLSLFSVISCAQELKKDDKQKEGFKFGADVLVDDNPELLKGLNIALVCNQTSVLSSGVHLADTLNSIEDINLVKLFSPEHGIRGTFERGINISDGTDIKTGLPVISLHGSKKKPSSDDLSNIDLIIFDIQDIGARFYTYISTLYYVLESAKENNVKVIVSDRPNPVNGITIAGPVLENKYKSFIGIAELPLRHGMTIGEIAFIFDELFFKGAVDLEIIKIQNWDRKKYYDHFSDNFIPPSPNIPDLETAILYPGIALLEGTNISEGRGTKTPFQLTGAPFINPEKLIEEINSYNLPGFDIEKSTFIPVSIKGMASDPKYKDQECKGIKISVTDRNSFEAVKFGVILIYSLIKLHPSEFKFNVDFFDKLAGNSSLRKYLMKQVDPETIFIEWENDLKEFNQLREKFLLY